MKKFTFLMIALMLCFVAQSQVTMGSVINFESIEEFGLDFNNDGNADFDVSWGYFTYYDYNDNNNIWAAGTSDSDWDFALALDEGTTIDAAGNWIGQGDAFVENYFTESLLTPLGTSTYMGFRIGIGSNIHYGWAKVTMAIDDYDSYYITVENLAYNATPNAAIAAGQTTGGGSSITEATNPIRIYPNPTTDAVIIETANLQGYELYDITGKLMITEIVSDNEVQINLSNLPRGIYIARVNANNSWTTQKIVKK